MTSIPCGRSCDFDSCLGCPRTQPCGGPCGLPVGHLGLHHCEPSSHLVELHEQYLSKIEELSEQVAEHYLGAPHENPEECPLHYDGVCWCTVENLVHQIERADTAEGRLRTTAQVLIEAVGADGPCDAEDAARRIVSRLAEVERELDEARGKAVCERIDRADPWSRHS